MVAGLVATTGMTFVVFITSRLGARSMEATSLLTLFLEADTPVGWMFHYIAGVILAVLYAVVLMPRMIGAPAVRGMIYSGLLWLTSQATLLGDPGLRSLSEAAEIAAWSLPGHLVYGALTGWLCATLARPIPSSTRARA